MSATTLRVFATLSHMTAIEGTEELYFTLLTTTK